MDEIISLRPAAADPFVSTLEAIDELRRGRTIVVVDDEDRENEGDLTIAAEHVTAATINFMTAYGRGLVCLALTGERCDELGLAQMCRQNTSRFGTAFCESIDAVDGTTTGVSCEDRARTIQQTVNPDCRPSDLARPGHIFPLRARSGGALARQGQTEASVDLARLAGLRPAGVICEIMNHDGTMARVPDLREFCVRHHIVMTSVAQLVRYRLGTECVVRKASESRIETEFGPFRAVSYRSAINDDVHVALVRGNPADGSRVLARVQSRCTLGDSLGAIGCECRKSIRLSLQRIAAEDLGVLVYLQEASNGWHCGGDSEARSAQSRLPDYESLIASQILSDLGLRTVLQMTGGTASTTLLESSGIHIAGQVRLEF